MVPMNCFYLRGRHSSSPTTLLYVITQKTATLFSFFSPPHYISYLTFSSCSSRCFSSLPTYICPPPVYLFRFSHALVSFELVFSIFFHFLILLILFYSFRLHLPYLSLSLSLPLRLRMGTRTDVSKAWTIFIFQKKEIDCRMKRLYRDRAINSSTQLSAGIFHNVNLL